MHRVPVYALVFLAAAGTNSFVGTGVASAKSNKNPRLGAAVEQSPTTTTTTVIPTPRPFTQCDVRPVPGAVESGFGARLDPITRRWSTHTGDDMQAAYGTPVRSCTDGVVSFAGWQSGYGWMVVVDHREDKATLYAHLSVISVQVGDVMFSGSKIGEVGSSGAATGAHLHFEVRVGGTPIDPIGYLVPYVVPMDPGPFF
jgi:murein DD-endopeptidase MepM/ murein hydrolase activator NlpD